MRPLKLEELIPAPAEFKLAKSGKTYHLRPVTLEDEAWLASEFGEQLPKIIEQMRMMDVARIAFRLLEETDKEDFAAREVTLMDDAGESRAVRMGGAKLLFAMISGYAEKMEIYRALLVTIGISRPLQDELVAEAERETSQKKSREEPLTGERSLTSSPVSTDGSSPTSESSP